ncbi:guanine-1-methyltransferase-domain-containing protein [Bisporella sp. PMI_857]|nr:guanine-1-methyltransferase-domain-containing protein [Bisporella sp. PMI_857]
MSDIEERPSKLRKLNNPQNDTDVLLLQNSDCPESESDIVNVDDAQSHDIDDKNSGTAPQTETNEVPKLSKNALKKLRKAQEWEAGLEDRRLKRRERHKAKQARKKEALQARQANGDETVEGEQIKRPPRPIPVPITFLMDSDFEEFMVEKELISLGAQLNRCYSENRRNSYRTHMVISSWKEGYLKTRFETVLRNDHLNWKGIEFTEKDFVGAASEFHEVMIGSEGGKIVGPLAEWQEKTSKANLQDAPDEQPKLNDCEQPQGLATVCGISATEKTAEVTATPSASKVDPKPTQPSVVYLTADSPHTLDCLSPYTTYIVGAIVDKNRHKGLCYKRACERGIATAKLPIGEYMTMQSRTVLAVNHVVEIMLKWLETGDWGEAFLKVIPKRKVAQLRSKKGQIEEAYDEDSNDTDTPALDNEENLDPGKAS